MVTFKQVLHPGSKTVHFEHDPMLLIKYPLWQLTQFEEFEQNEQESIKLHEEQTPLEEK